ncbi:dynein axonemal intermediate chain 3 [Halictus rubicundus]|uniref:dynein axonemal intermediate chain 3 n=1 Tax=Halictus rubicundus TaxID=77578 RepID=UPI004037066B
MSRKRVKCPLGWTLLAENIEDVERVKLDLETQRELGCVVGEHVFLEYPWAYVDRDAVAKLAKLSTSPLAAFRDRIAAYEAETFLVGYSSNRLISEDFVICLTVEARRAVAVRNKIVRRAIWDRVIDKARKKPAAPWKSLGSESEVDETLARGQRELFEIEIVLPGTAVGTARELCDRGSVDCRDSYLQLVNANEDFENVERRLVCRSVQTHSQPRDTYVQTYRGYLKNAWTQYAYEDTLNGEPNPDQDSEQGVESRTESERNDDERSKGRSDARSTESEDEPREKTPLDLFLEARSPEMIDIVKYNAAVNLHVDDIEDLSRRAEHGVESVTATTLVFRELVSFADANFTGNRAVSDISLRPRSTECVAIAYVTGSAESRPSRKKRSSVLVWRFDDPLVPSLELRDRREICSISFCPYNDGIVIGGCSNGLVVVWNIGDLIAQKKTRFAGSIGDNPPVVPVSVVSDERCSHRLAVRRIEWLPAKYGLGPGKTSGTQFLTASEDGTIAVWNLCSTLSSSLGSDKDNPIDSFRPSFRLGIGDSAEKPQSFRTLSFCLTSIGVVGECDDNSPGTYPAPNSEENGCKRCLWVGCTDGLIRCGWDDQMVAGETTNVVQCETLSRSHVHDGPVTEILGSPHLRDVLLTIGGHVFAIWKDDYPDSPLFWRRTGCRYTACCWASEPGVFLLGDRHGEIGLWDIRNSLSEPTFSRIVSSASITRLISLNRSVDGERVVTIGVGDEAGFFREFRERDHAVPCDETLDRLDWFEEYAWRETRRKKVFAGWQNDFLANDPAVVARRSARCDEQRRKDLEEARARLRKENEHRARSRPEKRASAVPKSADAVWRAKEYRRTRNVLLKKKNLDPSELERKRLPLVLSNAERSAKLKKARDNVELAGTYLSNAISAEFAGQFEPRNDSSETRSEGSTARPSPAKSVDEYVKEFISIRDKASRILAERLRSTRNDRTG